MSLKRLIHPKISHQLNMKQSNIQQNLRDLVKSRNLEGPYYGDYRTDQFSWISEVSVKLPTSNQNLTIQSTKKYSKPGEGYEEVSEKMVSTLLQRPQLMSNHKN